MMSIETFAHDIAVLNDFGKMIYYVFNSNKTELEVCYQGNSYSEYENEYYDYITIPSSVTYEGKEYPVTSIGDSAFYDCNELKSINLKDGITHIGVAAFGACYNLASITLGKGIKTIDFEAFDGCPLEWVYIQDIADWCNIDFTYKYRSHPYILYPSISYSANPLYPRLYGSGHKTARLIVNGFELTDLVIPEGIKEIKAFTFPCSTIETITIPASIEKIGEAAFGINDEARGYVNYNGFFSKRKAIYISDLMAWYKIEFYNKYANPLYDAHHLYLNGKEINNIETPISVKKINEGTFAGCKSLQSLVIPNGVNSIGESAFEGCSNLEKIVIPNTIQSIGKKAFADCVGLYSVTSLINIPFKLDETAFIYTNENYPENTIYMIATLYVPRGREAFYAQTDGWQKFTNIQATDTKFKLTYILDGEEYKTYEIQATEVITPEPDPYKEGYDFSGWSTIPWVMPAENVVVTGSFTPGVGLTDISSDNVTKSYIIYDLSGRKLSKMQRGVNVLRMKDGTTRKVFR